MIIWEDTMISYMYNTIKRKALARNAFVFQRPWKSKIDCLHAISISDLMAKTLFHHNPMNY